MNKQGLEVSRRTRSANANDPHQLIYPLLPGIAYGMMSQQVSLVIMISPELIVLDFLLTPRFGFH